MAELMPRTTDVLEAGMRSKLHVGAQLSVFFNGSSACDLAIGVCAPGRLWGISRANVAKNLRFRRKGRKGKSCNDVHRYWRQRFRQERMFAGIACDIPDYRLARL
jgi:hypothetical protein